MLDIQFDGSLEEGSIIILRLTVDLHLIDDLSVEAHVTNHSAA